VKEHIRNIFQSFCDEQSSKCGKDDDCIACALLWYEKRAANTKGKTGTIAQHLKAEIAALATELQDFNDRRVAAFGRVAEIVAKMRQLSAV